MATEAVSAPVNGTYGAHQPAPYSVDNQNFTGHQASNSVSTSGGYGSAPTPSSQSQSSNQLSKEEFAWYFVESYYTTMSRSPEKLYVRSLCLAAEHRLTAS